MYPFVQFVTQLVGERQVSVPAAASISSHERSAVAECLAEQDQLCRREATSAELPEFHVEAAVWGAEKLFHAGRLLMFQHAGREAVAEAFDTTPGDLPDTAEVHYSVDLALRFLPDLVRLARASACDSPVIDALTEFGSWWPLSSIGLGRVQGQRTAAVVAHQALCEMYLNRMLQTREADFGSDPLIRAALTRAVAARAVYPGISDRDPA